MHKIWKCVRFASVLLALLVGSSMMGQAAILYVDCCAPAGGDGSSWATAFNAIQDAIDAATEPSEVWVAAATCECNEAIILKSEVEIYGGFAGWEPARDQRDYEVNNTTINAAAAYYHVVTISDVTNTRVDGFTITGGRAVGPSTPTREGAGIYCTDLDDTNSIANCSIGGNYAYAGGGIFCGFASPKVANCVIRDNECYGAAGEWGGGIRLEDSSSHIRDCTIIGNWVSAFVQLNGGGVSFGAGCDSATMEKCIISGNWLTDRDGPFGLDGQGGGIYLGSSPLIKDCIISGNRSALGGGSYCSASPILTNCVISGNLARSGSGGGLWCSGFPSLINCTISSNAAATNGGGVYTAGTGMATFINTLFENNVGHAVHEGAGTSDPVLTHCLFYNNWVSGSTPGDYYDFDTSVTLLGAAALNAVTGNTGNVEGDPMYVMDDPFYAPTGIWSSTPAYNSTTRRTTLYAPPGTFTTDTLVGELINPNITQGRQALVVSNSTATVDVLGDATVYSASGDIYQIIDYRLACGSAAIDWGTASGAPSTDIEGGMRPVDIPGMGVDGTGQEYDIGAYEFQDIACPVDDWRGY